MHACPFLTLRAHFNFSYPGRDIPVGAVFTFDCVFVFCAFIVVVAAAEKKRHPFIHRRAMFLNVF